MLVKSSFNQATQTCETLTMSFRCYVQNVVWKFIKVNKNVLLHCTLSYDALDLVDLIVHLLGLTSKIIESKFIWDMNPVW